MLRVYISQGCRGCKRALELVSWVRKARPSLDVEVVDIATATDPSEDPVFAVPAYIYRSRPLFLGNPSQQELEHWLNTLEAEV